MKIILLLSIALLSFSASAKTVITLNKSSYICSVDFKSKAASKRINGQKYFRFRIQDIKLPELSMTKGALESSVESEWLNTGERYYISAYINSSIGPKHIPFTIPEKEASWNRYVDINIDAYLPCSCFRGADKPSRCESDKYDDVLFKDKFGNWWQQTGKDSARRIGKKIGEGSHRVWDAAKGGWVNIKDGWNGYKNDTE